MAEAEVVVAEAEAAAGVKAVVATEAGAGEVTLVQEVEAEAVTLPAEVVEVVGAATLGTFRWEGVPRPPPSSQLTSSRSRRTSATRLKRR